MDRKKTEAGNQPVPLYGKRQRKHRGPPGNGCRRQQYPALLTGKEITYSGFLYDRERRKKRQVNDMKINIAKSKDRNTTIGLDKIHFKEFFKQLWQKEQKALGIDKGMEFHL